MYQNKYLKYKSKYNSLKKNMQTGGTPKSINEWDIMDNLIEIATSRIYYNHSNIYYHYVESSLKKMNNNAAYVVGYTNRTVEIYYMNNNKYNRIVITNDDNQLYNGDLFVEGNSSPIIQFKAAKTLSFIITYIVLWLRDENKGANSSSLFKDEYVITYDKDEIKIGKEYTSKIVDKALNNYKIYYYNSMYDPINHLGNLYNRPLEKWDIICDNDNIMNRFIINGKINQENIYNTDIPKINGNYFIRKSTRFPNVVQIFVYRDSYESMTIWNIKDVYFYTARNIIIGNNSLYGLLKKISEVERLNGLEFVQEYTVTSKEDNRIIQVPGGGIMKCLQCLK